MVAGNVSWRVCFLVMLFGNAAVAEGADDERFFEAKVRPLIVKHCLKCHAGTKQKGGLRLDSKDGWQRGGDSGPAIVAGKPDNSLLVRAVRHDDGVTGMPPKEKLPRSAVQIIEEWVARGAMDPRRADATAGHASSRIAARSHWSYQPIGDPAVPDAGDEWSRTSIDRFVAEQHQRAGIQPVADADRYTWLRRVTFDLTGLPPAMADIEAFVADDAPDFRERAVERLLASPAFGEKWARHWLDLACYADTVGSASMPMTHAWRFRDYVIASLNGDKPLDQFVREQIAGDLLPAESPRQRREYLIATGFLAIGPWQLAEQDKAQLRMDIVDHQITRIGTMFLGMTLDCARCHDHKFDPIEQRDYYAMAGLFGNVDVLNGIWRSNVSAVVTVPLPELPSESRDRQAATPQHAETFSRAKQKWRKATKTLVEAESLAADLSGADGAQAKKKVEEARKAVQEAEGDWRFLEFHMPDLPRTHAVVRHSQIRNLHINVLGSAHAKGAEVPRGFVAAISPAQPVIPESSGGRLELVDWLFSADNPLTARVLANRVWTRFFGSGIVEQVDYFGVGSGNNEPVHRKLLDHLARKLQRGGSLKSCVREIVLSRTYALSAAADGAAEAVDPENRLVWRATPRRLDAEMIRDGLLFVSGRLHSNDGGPSLPLDRKALRPGDLVNPPTLSGGFEVPNRIRDARSIYQPVIRSYFHKSVDVLELFDTPSPNHIVGQRISTTVPNQALYLLNSPFVKEQATQLAQDILSDATAATDEHRLQILWLRTLGRPITDDHRASALAWLQAASDHEQAWSRLCHSVLASNEFLFRR